MTLVRKLKTKRCDRCGGTMILTPEPDCIEWDCLQCGMRQEEKLKESDFWYRKLSKEDRRRFADEAVLNGCQKTSEKYGIPLSTLIAWMGGFKVKRSVHLPQYPAFNEAWPESVKVAWLEGYKNLTGRPAKEAKVS